ncbi:27364_t:CDS:2 [Gigaspora margarita]|uniref:27364_t:CDS:1 n=1 Tax=Gigaspora margarita TaxID=4874 RepID=A0ABN7V5F4_GIGMA|nr:27364_t:CDS:2 [Gigaspora margarita]
MEESTMDSNGFYSSDNKEKNNNDDEAIPSTSTSTSNLKSVKKRKARRPESFLWKFFKKYKCTILLLDNQEEEEDTHHVTKELLADKPVQKKLTHQVACYIVSHAQPIHLVEVDDFKLFLKAHNSYLGITCHWLTDLFELHEIVLEIGELDDHCTTDIVESVNSVLDKFNINCQKIFSITTDNGANIKSAIQQMGITNIKCARHTLQLSVNLGLKKQLREAQLQIAPGLKEPLDVRRGAETMSSYLPLEEEFELLKELIEILSSFNDATEFLSGSKYSTLGFMTLMLEELARQLRYFTRQNDEAIFVKDTILNNLIERDLHHTMSQVMHSQFNELNSTDDNTALTNNNNTLHQHKKLKMASFFSYSRTENVTPNEFDRYCELPEVSLDEESCSLAWWRQHRSLFSTLAILAR